MSKRPGSPNIVPVKHIKVEDVWSQPTAPTEMRVSVPPHRPAFRPASGGLKTRVQQVYVLNFKPQVEATISLNGNQPEVRFTSPDSTICLTGDEFLQLANCRDVWPAKPLFLTHTRLEPLEDGSARFVRYEQNDVSSEQLPDFLPTALFDLTTYTVKRLRSKLDVMSGHIFTLMEHESAINDMFDCIAAAYKEEYVRMTSIRPLIHHFDELTRLVETHVPAARLVKDFNLHVSYCRLNCYSLLTCTLAQKQILRSMLGE